MKGVITRISGRKRYTARTYQAQLPQRRPEKGRHQLQKGPRLGETRVRAVYPRHAPILPDGHVVGLLLGATGSGAGFFARPTSGQATYGVLFDVETDQIAVQHYTGWDYSQGALSRGAVEGYLNAPAMTVSFASAGQRREDGSEVPRSAFSAHRRRHRLWN